MKKILMICPHSSQPRIHKRADQLNKISVLKVFAFKRRVYEQNSFSSEVNYNSLGYLNDGKYLLRPIKLIKAVIKIRKEDTRNSLFYALSIDCLVIAKLAGIKKGFYEIGDLRSAEKKNGILSKVEHLMLKKIKGVIITSKYFYSEYFKGLNYSKDKFLVIENKLNSQYFSQQRIKPDLLKSSKIKIGLIGLFRYEKPMRLLIDFIKKNEDRYQLECYGDGPLKVLLDSSGVNSITYHGSFKYPDDVKKIYQNIDLNFVVYDNNNENVTLALPNKLYESVYFGIPLLCASNTALSFEIKQMKVGRDISTEGQSEFDQAILSIDKNDILEFSQNANNIKYEKLIDSSKEQLKDLVNKA